MSESARRRLNIIETQVQRMEGIIQHYLSHTRGSPQKRQIKIRDLVGETLLLLNPILQQNGVEVTTDLTEPMPVLWGDDASLQRVLINLLDNAINASKEGGRLKVAARASNTCEAKRPGDPYRDHRQWRGHTGGVAAENFRPFRNHQTVRQRDGSGTGGLPGNSQGSRRHHRH